MSDIEEYWEGQDCITSNKDASVCRQYFDLANAMLARQVDSYTDDTFTFSESGAYSADFGADGNTLCVGSTHCWNPQANTWLVQPAPYNIANATYTYNETTKVLIVRNGYIGDPFTRGIHDEGKFAGFFEGYRAPTRANTGLSPPMATRGRSRLSPIGCTRSLP